AFGTPILEVRDGVAHVAWASSYTNSGPLALQPVVLTDLLNGALTALTFTADGQPEIWRWTGASFDLYTLMPDGAFTTSVVDIGLDSVVNVNVTTDEDGNPWYVVERYVGGTSSDLYLVPSTGEPPQFLGTSTDTVGAFSSLSIVVKQGVAHITVSDGAGGRYGNTRSLTAAGLAWVDLPFEPRNGPVFVSVADDSTVWAAGTDFFINDLFVGVSRDGGQSFESTRISSQPTTFGIGGHFSLGA